MPSSFSIAAIKNLLEKLSDYFDVLTFDYRGVGKSDPVTKDYSMADVSADVIGLLDAFNWDSCLLAGWSFGGIVAQEVAITAPERIQRLALLSTSPGGNWDSFPLESLATVAEPQHSEQILQLMDHRWTSQWLAEHPEDKLAD